MNSAKKIILAFTITATIMTNLQSVLASSSEAQKITRNIKSISQVKEYLKEVMPPCEGRCSGYKIASTNSINSKNKIPGKVILDIYDKTGIITNYDGKNPNLPRKDELGHYVTGKKDIKQVNRNKWFSIIYFQDGLVRPGIYEKGKIKYIGKNHYWFNSLIKIQNEMFVLHEINYYEIPNQEINNYYLIDLRKLNNSSIKRIDLLTAQRLGRIKRNR